MKSISKNYIKKLCKISMLLIILLAWTTSKGSDFSIYINSNTKLSTYVVEDLKNYLNQALGFIPKIENEKKIGQIIIESNSKKIDKKLFNNLSEDGFIIKSLNNNRLLITGRSDLATEFGIYFFLEKYLGVKWLLSSENWTVVPISPNFKLPICEDKISPQFKTRRLAPVNFQENNDLGKWGKRNLLHNEIQFNHNLYKIFSGTNEFAPTVNGKKIHARSYEDQSWQPNFKSKNIVPYTINKIGSYFKSNPNSRSYSLGINDSKVFDDTNFSEEKNKFGLQNASSVYYKWVKESVEGLNQSYPNKIYGLLAYENVASPPNFNLPANVVPFITLERLKWVEKNIKNDDLENLNSWNKVVKEVGWYDYIYGVNYIVPRSYFNLIASYLQIGNKNGVKHYVSEFYSSPLEGPKGWILSKLLVNPNLNADDLLNEWCVSAFGLESSKYIVEFYHLWEKFWTQDIRHTNWWNNSPAFPYLRFDNNSYIQNIPIDYIEQSTKLLNQALSSSSTTSQKLRLEELIKLWGFSKLNYVYFTKKNLSDIKSNSISRNQIMQYIKDLRKNPANSILLDYSLKFNKY